jgi:hypothetical protein
MSRTYRKAPLFPSSRRILGPRALRDGAVVRRPRAWKCSLRNRRLQAFGDPAPGRGPLKPAQWLGRARAHLQAMESIFGTIAHGQRGGGAEAEVCCCGQRHCDQDLVPAQSERWHAAR